MRRDDGDGDELSSEPETYTSRQQAETEASVRFKLERAPDTLRLFRAKHAEFAMRALNELSASAQSLDAAQPWLAYWNLQALDVLGELDRQFSPTATVRELLEQRVADHFRRRWRADGGGFSGFAQTLPHLASSYAAVNALVIVGTETTLNVIDRAKMHEFLLSRKHESGGFTMHDDGELDVRGTYCALSIAKLLRLESAALLRGVAAFVARCQSYEGGIGSAPGNEAHGGYTYCGLAATLMAAECVERLARAGVDVAALRAEQRDNALDLPLMLRWVTMRQLAFEGGFQGRTNKLVDACYTWWQGAVVALLQRALCVDSTLFRRLCADAVGDDGLVCVDDACDASSLLIVDQCALQRYVLACCQDARGGLLDKPSASRDYYHTCYALSGLAVAQHGAALPTTSGSGGALVFGALLENELPFVDLLHGVRVERVQFVEQWAQRAASTPPDR